MSGKRLLSRGWYVAAVIIAVAGWAAMVLFLTARLGGSADGMVRVLVPGETEARLSEPGRYTIFHEHRSTFEGRVYNLNNLPGMEIEVRASGVVVPLTRATSTSYTVGNRSGRSLYQFDVATPGFYRIVGSYPDGRREPQTVLAIDHSFVGEILMTIFGALAMAFGSTGLAIAIIAAVYIQRRRLRRADAQG